MVEACGSSFAQFLDRLHNVLKLALHEPMELARLGNGLMLSAPAGFNNGAIAWSGLDGNGDVGSFEIGLFVGNDI
jgi:hypothetical protein